MGYLSVITLCVCIGAALAVEPIEGPEPIPVTDAENNAGQSKSDTGEELFEGDMVIPAEGKGEGSDRNAINSNGGRRRWQKVGRVVEVPYTFHSSLTADAKKQFLDSAADYAAWTCIKFVPRSSQKDYIEVFRGGGCYSSVGRVGGKQTLSLGNYCDSVKGIPTHEMMHAMGFYHEQSRTDRDSFVYIAKENVNPSTFYNFEICRDCTNPSGLGYDYNSIMHYGATAFSSNKKETIIPRQSGAKIGQRAGMCDMDIKKLNQMYECNGVTASNSKPNDGIVPCKVPTDGWSNCAEFKSRCANPENNYQVLETCQKTCKGVKKGDAYNVYDNCDEMKSRCNEGWMKERCSKTCGTKPSG